MGKNINQYKVSFKIVFYGLMLFLAVTSVILVQQYISLSEAYFDSAYQHSVMEFSLEMFIGILILVLFLMLLFKDRFILFFLSISSFTLLALIRYIMPSHTLCTLVLWLMVSSVFFFSLDDSVIVDAVLFTIAYAVINTFPMRASYITVNPEGIPSYISFIILAVSIMWGISIFIINRIFVEYELTVNSLKYEKQMNKQLSDFNTTLQMYVQQYGNKSATEERMRITREMHDTNGYYFTNIMALMNAAISSGNQEWSMVEDMLQTASEQAHKGLLESRRVLHELRAVVSDENYTNSHKEVFQIVKIFQNCTGINVNVNWGNLSSKYESNKMLVITRIIQESLVNAVKHGHATRIQLYFWEQDNNLYFYIEDNGRGSSKIVKGIGLAGMEERLAPYHGKLTTENLATGGFKVTVCLPLEKEDIKYDTCSYS